MSRPIPLDAFLSRLQLEFPRSRIEVEPYSDLSDPVIEHFITLRDLRRDTVAKDDLRAWEIVREMYGTGDIPFHMVAQSIEAEDVERNHSKGVADGESH